VTQALLKLDSNVIPDEEKLRRLARFIAMEVYDLDAILKNEGIDPSIMAQIVDLPLFQNLLKQAQEDWSSTDNTADRINLKSKVLVEEFLEEAHARLHDPKENLLHKVALLKEVAKMGGIGTGDAPQTGEKIQVIINLPSQTAPVVVDIPNPTPAIEAEYEEVDE